MYTATIQQAFHKITPSSSCIQFCRVDPVIPMFQMGKLRELNNVWDVTKQVGRGRFELCLITTVHVLSLTHSCVPLSGLKTLATKSELDPKDPMVEESTPLS